MLNNEMFSIVRNGYSKEEVEAFFAEMKKVNTETVRAHRTEKEKLKQELEEARNELNEYRRQPDMADKILRQAEAKKEEIIDASKECLRLEILKLLELYKEEVDTFVKIKEEVYAKYGEFDDADLEKKLSADRFRNRVKELLAESLGSPIDEKSELVSHYEAEKTRLEKRPLRFDETNNQKVGARLTSVSTNGYSKLLSKYLVPHRTKEELLGVNEKTEEPKQQTGGFNLREALITKATLDEIMEGFDFYRN